MKRLAAGLAGLLFVLFASGCSTTAPNYSASIPNVGVLKKAGAIEAKVGDFSSTPGEGNANPISLRGNSLQSPYQSSYANYIAEAIKQEFSLAGKLNPQSKTEISGFLQKNDLDAAIGTGTGKVQVRVIVKKDGKLAYDQVKSMADEWESSFAGPIAIPRAAQEYPLMIQKLLAELYVDPAFIDALK